MSDLPEKREEQAAVATRDDAERIKERYQELLDIAGGVHEAGLAPSGHDNPATTAICMLTGHELGIPPMQSLNQVYVVDGKASLSAQAMKALVYKHNAGTFETEESEDDKGRPIVTVTGTRSDNGDTESVTWDLKKAKRAGLLNKYNWQNYPYDMLWSRATAAVARKLWPDIVGGLYTPEEHESIDSDDREPVQGAEAQVIDSLGLQPDQDGEVPDAPRKALGNGTEDTTEGED